MLHTSLRKCQSSIERVPLPSLASYTQIKMLFYNATFMCVVFADNTVSSALSKTKQREHHLPKNASPIAQLDAGNFLDRIKSLHSPPLTLLALTMHRLLLIISDVLLLSCPVPIKRVLNSFLQERFERHNITGTWNILYLCVFFCCVFLKWFVNFLHTAYFLDVPILSVTRQRTEGKDLFIAIQTYEALRLPHDPLLLKYVLLSCRHAIALSLLL